jgi:aspartate/methionine/tyrosine aminotransferase
MLMTFQVLGITPVPLPLSPTEGFTPSLAAARQILESQSQSALEQSTGTVKAIILVTPNNPTGCTYPPELIEQFADLAKEYGTCLVIDETYRDFIPPSTPSSGDMTPAITSQAVTAPPPGKPHNLFQRPDWRTHVISVGSFSKSYKIPGHRLGFVVAGEQVMSGLTTVSDCIQVRPAPKPFHLPIRGDS